MRLKSLLLVAALLSLNITFSQTRIQNKFSGVADSLLSELKTETKDTVRVKLLSQLAFEFRNGKSDTALIIANEALALTTKIKFEHGKAEALWAKGSVLNSQGKNDEAMKILKEASLLSKRPRNLAAIYTQLGSTCQNIGDFEEALSFHTKSLEIYSSLKELKGLGIAHVNIGGVHFSLNHSDEAMKHFLLALKYKTQAGETKSLSRVYSNIGNTYRQKGDYPKALEYSFKALRLNEENKDKKAIANSLNYIGQIYILLENYKDALTHLERSLELRKEIGDKRGVSNSLTDISTIFTYQGNYEKSIDYLKEALELRKEMNDRNGIAVCYQNLAGNYFYLEKYDKGISYYNLNLKLCEEIEDRHSMGVIYSNLGATFAEREKFSEARNYFSKALAVMKEFNDKLQLRDLYLSMAKTSNSLGDYKSALDQFQLHVAYRDSLVNEANTEQIVKTQMQYEFDKKEAVAAAAHKLEFEKQEAVNGERSRRQTVIIVSVILVLLLVSGFAIFIMKSLKKTKQQKIVIEHQKHLVEEKQREIIDSINYARRIQHTLLAHADFLKSNLPDHFVYFNPKDIVSGDFYWATKRGSRFFLAVCDSTGHGVPGAFMSLLNISFMNEAITEKGIEQPNEVFNFVRRRLIDNISKEGQKDGFDGILVSIDSSNGVISYAAANNSPLLISGGEARQLPCDRMPVGQGEKKDSFTLHHIQYRKGDVLYLYTDGFADQFGGPKGKKFMNKRLNEHLISIHSESTEKQKQKLKETFEDWRGMQEQVDDVCIIGCRF